MEQEKAGHGSLICTAALGFLKTAKQWDPSF